MFAMQGTSPPLIAPPTHGPIHKRHVLYPDAYAWYVLASALDVMITVTVLVHFGAREVNTFAQWTIDLSGTWGLIALKFISVIVVVAICEHIGRKKMHLGRMLAIGAIFVSLLPVTAALSQVAYLTATGRLLIQDWPPEHGVAPRPPRQRNGGEPVTTESISATSEHQPVWATTE
jgi:hypothetical protein